MLDGLKVGYQIKFSQLSQQELNNKVFTILEINIYQFKNKTNRTLTIADNNNNTFYITDISNQNDTDLIAVSRTIQKKDICLIFDMKELALVFNGGIGYSIVTKNIIKSFHHWIETEYQKYFHEVKGKYYNNSIEKKTEFDYYTINAENSSIDIEVFARDKVIFYNTIYIPNTAIII